MGRFSMRKLNNSDACRTMPCVLTAVLDALTATLHVLQVVLKTVVALFLFLMIVLRTVPTLASYEVTISIPVSVEISGSSRGAFTDTVTVTMVPQDDAPSPNNASITIAGATAGTFEGLTYTKPGDYVYTVQMMGTSSDIEYDAAIYTVTVRVTNSDGGLSADYWATKDSNTGKAAEIVFSNTVIADEIVYYVVEHYLEQTDGSYELEDSYTYSTTAGTTVTAVPNTYENYTENTTHESRISSGVAYAQDAETDGWLTLRLYYDLRRHTVRYIDGVDGSIVFEDQYYTELLLDDEIPDFLGTPTREGYNFLGWNEVVDDETGDILYVAMWEPIGTENEETELPSEALSESSSDGGSTAISWKVKTGDVKWYMMLGCVVLLAAGCLLVIISIRKEKGRR